MSVDDFGIEVLKKAAIPLTPGSKSEYSIRTYAAGGDSVPLPVLRTVIETQKTATTTPAIANVTGSNMTNRAAILITPLTGVMLRGLTAATCSIEMQQGSTYEIDCTEDVDVYVASQTGTVDYIVTEGSGL